jgi:hypothetical protein
MGIRTPDLLHAMNHSAFPRPGTMRPEQARHELTLAATGPGKPSLAPFAPQTAPRKISYEQHGRPASERSNICLTLHPIAALIVASCNLESQAAADHWRAATAGA